MAVRADPVRYEVIDHTADLGIRVFGENPSDLFANAGRVLFEQITETETLAGARTMSLEVDGADWADLLVNWLRELLFLWSGKRLLAKEIEVTNLSETHISARLRVDPFDPERHPVNSEIKAVTYHQVEVTQGPDEWVATVIFDV